VTTDYLVGSLVVVAFMVTATFGERIQKWHHARRLRRHACPAECEESRRCKCGCDGLLNIGWRQEKCAVCGTDIVYADMEITNEMPAPRGFTSWGWERDREFRRHLRGWGK